MNKAFVGIKNRQRILFKDSRETKLIYELKIRSRPEGGQQAPQLQQNNMHKLARVVLDEPLAFLTSYNVVDRMASCPELACKLNCEIFTDFDDALFWLNE